MAILISPAGRVEVHFGVVRMETAGEIVMTSVAGPSQSVSPQSVQSGTQNNQNSSTSSTHHNQVIISNSFVQSTTPTQSIEINPAVVQSSNPGALNLYSSSQESFVQSSTTSTPQLILSPETFDQTQTVTSLPHTIVLPAEAYAQRITADRLLSQTAILAPESFVQSSTSAVAAQDTPETAVSVKVEPGEGKGSGSRFRKIIWSIVDVIITRVRT